MVLNDGRAIRAERRAGLVAAGTGTKACSLQRRDSARLHRHRLSGNALDERLQFGGRQIAVSL